MLYPIVINGWPATWQVVASFLVSLLATLGFQDAELVGGFNMSRICSSTVHFGSPIWDDDLHLYFKGLETNNQSLSSLEIGHIAKEYDKGILPIYIYIHTHI